MQALGITAAVFIGLTIFTLQRCGNRGGCGFNGHSDVADI